MLKEGHKSRLSIHPGMTKMYKDVIVNTSKHLNLVHKIIHMLVCINIIYFVFNGLFYTCNT